MSGGHAAHAPSATGGSSNIQLAKNLATAGKDTLKTGKNALVNGSNAVRTLWKNVAGRVGDILIKKPVSAALHLAGGPVAKVVDGTFSGVARALTLGKIKKVQPLAKTFKTTDSLVASVVDSVAAIKPQWSSREWSGTRGYLKRVHGKLINWKKTTEEAHKAKKAAKKEAKSHKAEHPAKDDHHAKESKKEEHHEPHAPKAVASAAHEDHAHHTEKQKPETDNHHDNHATPADGHKEEHTAHAPEEHAHNDSNHGHAAPADVHTDESHATPEEHAPKDEAHGHTDEPKKDEHGHAAPAH